MRDRNGGGARAAPRRSALAAGVRAALLAGGLVAVSLVAAGGTALAAEAAARPAAKPVSIQELLRRGGPIMWPLGLCSIVALAFAVERFVNLRSAKVVPKGLVRAIESGLAGGRLDESLKAIEADRSAAARILAAGMKRRHESPEAMKQAMAETGQREVSRLRDNILPLNVIANIAPLLGLLGTVFGMIEAFKEVAGAGLGKPEVLASGIYRALVTTAVGLTIAIPALALYYYFNGRIVRHLRRIDEVAAAVLERFRPGGTAA